MKHKEKNPMTKEGYERLMQEWESLAKVERPKTVKGVQDAAAEGDRSENAEYIYGKKRLREIDKRLQYLSTLLKDVVVVERASLKGEVVCFGSTVVVRDEKGETKRWTIVGDGEADTREGTISHRSPVGRALLGKHVGCFLEVELPRGNAEFELIGLLFADSLVAGKKE